MAMVRGRVHQRIELIDILDIETEYPSFTVRIGVDEAWLLLEFGIHFYDFSRRRRIDV